MSKPRNELKYFINTADYLAIKNRIKYIASLDINASSSGTYHIRSLYFDNFNDKSENDAIKFINNSVKKHVVKSKTVSANSGIELTIEIRLKEMSTQFVNELSHISGVNNVVLVSYNGEYMS